MPKPESITNLANAFKAAADSCSLDYLTAEAMRIVRDHWQSRGYTEPRAMEEISRHLLAGGSCAVTNGNGGPRSARLMHDLNKEAMGVGVQRVHR